VILPVLTHCMRTLFVGQERRRSSAQRGAIERELAQARGRAAVVRFADGTVYVYDERRTGPNPGTRRVLIEHDGTISEEIFLRF
jgi:hypothetical protein